MDRKRESKDAKGKGKLTMPPTRKSLRLAGLPPFVPTITSPRSVLRPNKLLMQAIAAVKGEPIQKQVPKLQWRHHQLTSRERKPLESLKERYKARKPPQRNHLWLQPKPKRRKKKNILKTTILPILHFYLNYDGDLDQWGTDVVGGEPVAAHDWDSTGEEEEDYSTSSDSTN
ncbi:hypothetical protein PIB30_023660 [Stylosanthes scabra]|uniref:Uncharacterized protein n=1 Tax=Stylosanthes scabra TaxID=79078 RepID=A0ABU6R9T1_9FABA|nr:hypothetical protein [Stylosanthes scabra]